MRITMQLDAQDIAHLIGALRMRRIVAQKQEDQEQIDATTRIYKQIRRNIHHSMCPAFDKFFYDGVIEQ